MSNPGEIPVSDDELRKIHQDVLDNCPPSFGNILVQNLLDALPRPVQHALVSPEHDPREAPIRAGEKLAEAIGLSGPDQMMLAIAFGSQTQRIAAGRLKPTFFPRSARHTSRRRDYAATSNRLIEIGERLATVFTLPDLDPAAARNVLLVAARDLDRGQGTGE